MVEYYAIIKDEKSDSGETLAYLAHCSSYTNHSHGVLSRSRSLFSKGLVKKVIACRDGVTHESFFSAQALVERDQVSPEKAKAELELDRYKELRDLSGFSFSILLK